MINLDEQITRQQERCHGYPYNSPVEDAILLSLRRLKRIEELIREPSEDMFKAVADEDARSLKDEDKWASYSDLLKSGNAALLKQVEEEVK